MNKKIDLTIVVPIYNVEEYLEECLESLYKLRINKEVILVNDGSTDNSYLIMKKYKDSNAKETIIINQKNQGLSSARNTGLKIATGEYIAFIDSDDFIDSKKYERMFIEGKSKGLDIIMGNYQRYTSKDNTLVCKKREKLKKLGLVTGKEFFKDSIKSGCFREEVCDDIYKKSFLFQNNLKFKENLLHEDTLFFIQALNKAKKVEYFDIAFYFYRQRSGSITKTLNKRNYEHKLFIINYLIESKRKNQINLEYLNGFLISLLWDIMINYKGVNISILKKILLTKGKYRFRDIIKILAILGSSFKYNSLDLIVLDKIKK